MAKLLVKSISFKKDERGRYVSAFLGNYTTLEIWCESPAYVVKTDSPRGRMTKTESEIADLIYSACVSYLIGDDEETMSYSECYSAGVLATTRFDWVGAGFPGGSDSDKEFTLNDCISHFCDI